MSQFYRIWSIRLKKNFYKLINFDHSQFDTYIKIVKSLNSLYFTERKNQNKVPKTILFDSPQKKVFRKRKEKNCFTKLSHNIYPRYISLPLQKVASLHVILWKKFSMGFPFLALLLNFLCHNEWRKNYKGLTEMHRTIDRLYPWIMSIANLSFVDF